jgi:hypothetical protein
MDSGEIPDLIAVGSNGAPSTRTHPASRWDLAQVSILSIAVAWQNACHARAQRVAKVSNKL